MKIWLVPASLFGPGRLMAPHRLSQERERLVARQAKLEAELAALPGKITDLDRRIAELGSTYVPVKAAERD
jgi:hypothetical protein